VASLHNACHLTVLGELNTIAEQSARYLIPLSLRGELAGALLLLAMGFVNLV